MSPGVFFSHRLEHENLKCQFLVNASVKCFTAKFDLFLSPPASLTLTLLGGKSERFVVVIDIEHLSPWVLNFIQKCTKV